MLQVTYPRKNTRTNRHMLWKLSNLAKLPFNTTSRLLRKHFDKRFYISTYPEVINSGLDPIEHYCVKGWREGFNPRPDFDTLYYRASNPDIAKAGINPFVHYLLHGREEGRLSQAPDERDRSLALDYFIIAPEFDVDYYLSEYPDVKNAKLDPIKHFDKRFYISTYPEVINSGLDPIEHYCVKGWREGFNPRPDFDTLYYRASNPDIAKAGINPFVHYLLHGREEGRLSQAPDERDRSLALDYFIIAPEFDVNYYLSEYLDVKNAKLDPIKHYVTSGWKEARRPRADFHTTYYYLKNKDVIPSGVNPFRHYIETGRQQGRSPCRQSGREPHLQLIHTPNLTTALDAVPSLRPLNENDYCLEVPFQIELNTPPVRRIAAIIHVYYTDLFPKIVQYLKNVPFQTDLFISTDTTEKKSLILESLKTYSNGTVEVRVFENRGRDIAPFIVGYAHVLKDYEYFIHLHTKRSPHGGDPLEGWLDYLLSNLLGSQQIVKSVFKLLLECNVGIIYPQHLFVLRGILNWGYDFELAASLLSAAGFVLDKLRLLEFPSGSMFWGRSAALRPLLDLQLQFSDFPDEARQVDGTLAHAIERTILYFAELAGFRWAKILSDSEDYPVRNAVLQTESEDDILVNLALTYRPLLLKQLSGRTTTEKSIPETRSIIYYPSINKRPRLNLLVPTINPSQSFGGVSTALNIFRDLEKLYEFDSRFSHRGNGCPNPMGRINPAQQL